MTSPMTRRQLKAPWIRIDRWTGSWAAGLAVLLTLTACGGNDSERLRICPRVGVLYDASRLTLFGPSGEEIAANITYDLEMTNARIQCDFDDTRVVADIEFELIANRGPAATPGKMPLRYFIAVTELNQRVLDKRYQVYELDMNPGQQRLRVTRSLKNISFDFGRLGRPDLYEILVGWDLTPAQLEFNRSQSPFDRPRVNTTVRPSVDQ